ncbi:atrial natriuretic peptide receptor 2-like [Heteronotia binoei]|uniref:atrial natriuretic peptide receptor 2-like n=1 Tax=Heteronotia binoei TaxID=13085 RepID=UPI00292DC51A|nr:atrial natriuretic peptide receptor 2-like [Heteronotia binoei]
MAAPPPLLLLLLPALLGVPSAASAQASAAPSGEVRLGVLLPRRNLRYPWAWPRVKPALSLALESQLRPPGLALRTAFASTEDPDGDCDFEMALWKAAKLKCLHDLDVLLGAGCGHPAYFVGRLARHWQLPLLRAGAYGRSSVRLGSTVVYAGLLGPALDAFLLRLHRRFNWTSPAALVYDEDFDYWQYYSPFFMRFGVDVWTTHSHGYGQPEEAVRFIRAKGRVVYISGPLKMLQEIMHQVQAQNMTGGDYIFIYLDVWGESMRAEGHREAKKPWQSTESQDTGILREAFQTVLVVTPHEPQTPEYRRFQSQLVQRAQRDFGVAVNDSVGTLVAGCFHDVLLLYLRALNETLQEGGTKRNTSRILEKMRGLKFQGVTGTVSLNGDNEREMDFDLWAMRDVESGEFQVVAHFVGSENQTNWLGPIHWKKGSPPLDNPPCVFDMDDPSCGKSGCVQGQFKTVSGGSRPLALVASPGGGVEPPVDKGPPSQPLGLWAALGSTLFLTSGGFSASCEPALAKDPFTQQPESCISRGSGGGRMPRGYGSPCL